MRGTETNRGSLRKSGALRWLIMGTLVVSFAGIRPQAIGVPIAHAGGPPPSQPTNLPVSFSVPTGAPCAVGSTTLNGDGTSTATVTLLGAGSCAVTASQAGNAQYNAADPVTQSFSIAAAPTTLTLGSIADTAYHDAVSLSATVSPTSIGAQKATGTVTFAIDGTSVGSSPVNSSGVATLSPTISQAPGLHSVTASFVSSNANFGNSSTAAASTFHVLTEDTSLSYLGDSAGNYHDAVTLKARLLEDGDATKPLSGKSISFTLGSQSCSGTTDGTGTASCPLTISQHAGSISAVSAAFAGDSFYAAGATGAVTFAITKEETSLAYTGPLQLAVGSTPTVSALLKEDGATALAGRSVTITIGSGASAQSCSGTTSSSGVAGCTLPAINQAGGSTPVSASFAGDTDYLPASDASQHVLVYAWPAKGAFVIGDTTAQQLLGSTTSVQFWGPQWTSKNTLSGGPAPSDFFGYAKTLSATPPTCGTTWTTSPGASSLQPPINPPTYMAVIVASSITKSGSTISGNEVKIGIVKTTGSQIGPGSLGTGPLVAVFCPGPSTQVEVADATPRTRASSFVLRASALTVRDSPFALRDSLFALHVWSLINKEGQAKNEQRITNDGALPWHRALRSWRGQQVEQPATSKQDQQISFGSFANHTFGDNPFTITAESVTTQALPPDPSTVAPPLNNTVTTGLLGATSFMYMRTNPIQTGVAPGTITATRVAILRGKVLNRDGTALPGAIVTVLNHPEYGRTISRADGAYDLAVNGGGALILNFSKDGFIPAQRQVAAPWDDYAQVDTVALVPFDSNATSVTFSSGTTSVQTAQGSTQTDSNGSRQQTVLFPAGTTASMVMPNGSTQPLASGTVRATEFTVGANGPTAMPAGLPPNSAYTYCVELSIDQAVTAGAASVQFSKPVIAYNQNFVGVPAGTPVPVGHYDKLAGQWVADPNGLVIKILSISGGEANLDVDGSGNPATGAQYTGLGITDAERTQLATTYSAGTSLWRVAIAHFSTLDFNWSAWGPRAQQILNKMTDDLERKAKNDDEAAAILKGLKQQGQGTIDQTNQLFGEDQSITGTPFRLHYASDHQADFTAARSTTILLSNSTIPDGLKEIDLRVDIAGKTFTQTFSAAPNLSYTFTWDGKDAYGRTVQGRQTATITITDIYPLQYGLPADAVEAFGKPAGVPVSVKLGYGSAGIALRLQTTTEIGSFDARTLGLGGWTLTAHHVYDPTTHTLYFGNGQEENARSSSDVINAFAGTGSTTSSGDGGPATSAGMIPRLVITGPDGSVYLYDSSANTIRKIDPNGIISTIAGGGPPYGDPACATDLLGDGCKALDASLDYINGMALGPDGSIYFTQNNYASVRRITPDGIVHLIAGTLTNAVYNGDNIPATTATLYEPDGLSVAQDGTVYVADYGNDRIRRIGTDGIISTVAGNGSINDYYLCDGPENVPATQSCLYRPQDVKVAPDGSLYLLGCGGDEIRKVDTLGMISNVTADCPTAQRCGFCNPGIGPAPDGQPAVSGGDGSYGAVSLAIDATGNVYFAYADRTGGPFCYDRINEITPDGLTYTVAGSRLPYGIAGCPLLGNGGPATGAIVGAPAAIAIGPDGSLYDSASGDSGWFIRRVALPLPGIGASDILIPSPDGSQIFRFDASGRHLQTLDARTGAVLLTFGYDAAGLLHTVTDADGNVTTINHDANGNPTSIVSPYGDATKLTTDANGYLASIANPLPSATGYAYSPGGLLQSVTGPNGNTFSEVYDSEGRLTRATDPLNGSTTLSPQQGPATTTVSATSALGRTDTFAETDASNQIANTISMPDGTSLNQARGANGTLTDTGPTGMTKTLTLAPDPRFGMSSPYGSSATMTSPGGLTLSVQTTRSATLSQPGNPLSMTSLSDSWTVNGNAWTKTYTQANRTQVVTSPLGRQSTVVLDARGNLSSSQIGTLAPSSFTYDLHGRPSTLTLGTGGSARTTTYGYGGNGQLASAIDPLGRTTSLTYNAADDITSVAIPGEGTMHYGYDAGGNLISMTTPGGRAFTIGYDKRDMVTSFTPPSVNGSNTSIQYTYNADRHLTAITRPDGQTVGLSYDSTTGKLSSMSLPEGTITYGYDAGTGLLTSVSAPNNVRVAYTNDGSIPTGATWTGPVAGSVGMVYDNFFRISSQSINGGNTVSYGYDADGLLTGAGSLTLARDANGLVTGYTLDNLSGTIAHNAFGEPTSQQESVSGAGVYSVSYNRDMLGRIASTSATINGATHSYVYTYDPQSGHLTTVVKDGNTTEQYTYDADGNRLTGPGVSSNATYDAQGELTQYGSTAYTYDAAGQIATKTDGSGVTTYSYDPAGRLLSVALPGSKNVSYILDGDGRRVGKQVNGTLTQGYLYDSAGRIVALLDGSGALRAQFVYSGEAPPAYMVTGGTTYRIISDQVGSPRLIVDSNTGQVMEQIDYDAFGNQTVSNVAGGWDATLVPFGFGGGLYDPDTGLIHLGTRDYDPHTGRWTARDPLGLGAGDTATLYGYAFGDPVNVVDPSGAGPYIQPGEGPILAGTKPTPSGDVPHLDSTDPNNPEGNFLDPSDDLGNLNRAFQNWAGNTGAVGQAVADHPYLAVGTITVVGAGAVLIPAGVSALAAANAGTPTLTGLGALNALEASGAAASETVAASPGLSAATMALNQAGKQVATAVLRGAWTAAGGGL